VSLTITQLTSSIDGTDQSSYTTASISPTQDRTVLLSLEQRIAVGVAGGPGTPTVSGCGLTWTLVKRVTGSGGTPNRAISVWQGTGVAVSGTVTINCNGETHTHVGWSIQEVSEFWTVYQSVSANDNGVNGTTATVTLAALASRNNVAYAWAVITSSLTLTVGSGFTQQSQVSEATDGTTELVETKLNETVCSCTWTGNNSWMIVGLELAQKLVMKQTVTRPGPYKPGLAR